MIIIGVDFHPEFQQIASVDTESGEFQERRLGHPAEAEQFYRALSRVPHTSRTLRCVGVGCHRNTSSSRLLSAGRYT